MTVSELKDILVNRIGWGNDRTQSFALSPDNSQSDSGRYYQEGHSMITLENILNSQPQSKIDEDDFNSYLQELQAQAVSKVCSDVFEKDYINDSLMSKYPTMFDNLLIKAMTIKVSELLLTTSRSNRIQRITEKQAAKLHHDVFRDLPDSFPENGHLYRNSLGVSSAYAFDLSSVQRRAGVLRNQIKTITSGALNSEHYFEGK